MVYAGWDFPRKNGEFASATWYNKQNGLTENAVKKVFEDLEGNIWIATYGGGLTLFAGQAFSFIHRKPTDWKMISNL